MVYTSSNAYIEYIEGLANADLNNMIRTPNQQLARSMIETLARRSMGSTHGHLRVYLGRMLPWAITCTDDGALGYGSSSGSRASREMTQH